MVLGVYQFSSPTTADVDILLTVLTRPELKERHVNMIGFSFVLGMSVSKTPSSPSQPAGGEALAGVANLVNQILIQRDY
jgi:hypothetical protein